jgi:hypothetical protein
MRTHTHFRAHVSLDVDSKVREEWYWGLARIHRERVVARFVWTGD